MESFYKVREFNTIRELMDITMRDYADNNAFEVVQNNKHYFINYRQYVEMINSLSTALVDAGMQDRCVAICADNCYEYCLTYIATICAGAVIVPIDKELGADDIFGIIRACDAGMLVCDDKILEKLEGRDSGVECYRLHTDSDSETAKSFDNFVDKGRKIIAEGRKLYLDVKQDPEKMCTLLFTSGTTGVSKGVMLCQRNFVFEIKAAMGVIKIYQEDCAISILPLHHTFESSIIIFFAPYCGAKITFCEGLKYVLRNMKEFNPTVFVAVPLILETVHRRILREIHKKKHGELKFKIGKSLCKVASKFNIDLKKVVFKEIQETFGGKMRMIICGGAAIDPQIIKDFDSFGIQVVYGYGLTECAPLAIINHDRLHTTDSVGAPLPGAEAKIINADENGIGEVCVKGGMVMLGYYKNPDATAEVIDSDGFFHTGDLGYVDKRGCYHLTGRCKNVIVTSNGKNIYPEEIEYHLCCSNFVNSCMVEGIPDSRGELIVHAQIFPEAEDVAEALGTDASNEQVNSLIKKIVDEVNAKLPAYKAIKSFAVRKEDFVRTTAKKIKRNVNSEK